MKHLIELCVYVAGFFFLYWIYGTFIEALVFSLLAIGIGTVVEALLMTLWWILVLTFNQLTDLYEERERTGQNGLF